jgi:hypothetical protein
MYNVDFTEYDQTFSKNTVILEKCSFRDNVTIRFSYGMLNLLVKSNFYFISLASLKPADVVNILTVTFKIMSKEILSLNRSQTFFKTKM